VRLEQRVLLGLFANPCVDPLALSARSLFQIAVESIEPLKVGSSEKCGECEPFKLSLCDLGAL
jgi:hypothetical protein